MRDANGNWIWGYNMHIGNTTSTQAELWVIRQGLSKEWIMGHKRIILEIISLMVVKMLTTNNVCMPLLSTFVNYCMEFLNRT